MTRRWLFTFLILQGLGMAWTAMASTAMASTAMAAKKTHPRPYLRLQNPVSRLLLSPSGRYLAFIESHPSVGALLNVLELKTGRIYEASRQQVGAAFVWAPQGFRLFYREQVRKDKNAQITSTIKAFDASLHTTLEISKISGPTGYLSLDPLDLRLRFFTENKLVVHALRYPESRLAKWQNSLNQDNGHWVITQRGALWATQADAVVQKLADDQSPLESYALSPDGRSLAWSTAKGHLYLSHGGQPPLDLGYGKQPSWHPQRKLLIYSGARMLGKVAARFDLKVSDGKSEGQWLTHSQHSDELWPVWLDATKILFTLGNTSDLYTMDFNDAKPTFSASAP